MKRTAVVLITVALAATACSSAPKGAQTYTMNMDAPSPAGKNLQFSAFYPGTIKVRPGDTIVVKNVSSQAPHTISFGINATRSNQPSPGIPGVGNNPAVFFPCVSNAEPTAKLTKCPQKTSKTLPAYTGKGYWNSGFLARPTDPQLAHEVTLKLADSIPVGSYNFVCILHGPMTGVLQVVAKDGDRKDVDVVATDARGATAKAQSSAKGFTTPATGLKGTTFNAAAGWGGNVVVVNRFAPATIDVKAGTSVVWTAGSKFEPHTVTFGSGEKAGAENAKYLAPSGVKSGGAYSGGLSNSGIYGPPGSPFPPGPFRLTFTKAGTYAYVCILHPFMQGTVKVS